MSLGPDTLDFPLMPGVKFPVVVNIEPQSNKFVTGVESKATGVSKRNDSPVRHTVIG